MGKEGWWRFLSGWDEQGKQTKGVCKSSSDCLVLSSFSGGLYRRRGSASDNARLLAPQAYSVFSAYAAQAGGKSL
jgi:hypothetical protein